MKNTELKIGDIVDYMGSTFKVTSIYENNVIGIEEGLKVYCDDVVPIELTKEILEKNGWELGSVKHPIIDNKIAAEMSQFARKSFVVLMFDKYERSFNHDFENDRLAIRYVHELQHLLWAIGLDDNLKI